MKIGVFDSGVGGKLFADVIKEQLPDSEIILREDKANLPYGTKSKSQLLKLVSPIFLEMERQGCDVIVVACNTVTTNIIGDLRQKLNVPLVGIEPMIKPASGLTETNQITVCATPATLNSDRYKWLKSQYAKGISFYEPDCSRWAKMIEDRQIDEEEIKSIVEHSSQMGSDVIVLGCTHYHWIYDLIDRVSGPSVKVLQPTDAAMRQLKTVLEQLG